MTLNELADAVERARRSDNFLDVKVEIALFKPGRVFSAVRANNAGTKVIYTDPAGNDVTCWAQDWTYNPALRASAAARLRARAMEDGRG